MTVYGLSAVATVCAFASLLGILVLRHLEKLHLTKTQAAELKGWAMEKLDARREDLERLTKDLADLSAKHSQLSNRSGR